MQKEEIKMAVVRAISAEWLKMRRTLALWLAPLAPLVIVALQVAVVLQRESYFRTQELADTWLYYGTQTVWIWTMLMLPLFITLETALLGNLEHSNQQWKHLFALPIPRGAIYAAKQLSSMVLIGVSMASLFLLLVLSGWGLRLVAPGLGFEQPVPWLELLKHVGLAYLASWLIISIHTWIGLRWHSFVVASATGIVAMVVAVLVLQSDLGPWYPWTLSGMVLHSLEEGLPYATQLLLGSLGGLVVAVVGGWDVVRRDVL
jgi:hypothetical protein